MKQVTSSSPVYTGPLAWLTSRGVEREREEGGGGQKKPVPSHTWSLGRLLRLPRIAARAMAPDSSRNFGEQDFVTSHKPWSLQSSNFAKKFKFCLALEPHLSV